LGGHEGDVDEGDEREGEVDIAPTSPFLYFGLVWIGLDRASSFSRGDPVDEDLLPIKFTLDTFQLQ
jgi:hypothetical protein